MIDLPRIFSARRIPALGKSLAKRLSLASEVLLLSSALLHGQAGRPAFVPLDDHGYDSINLQQLNVEIHAPLFQKAGANPLSITFSANSYCTGATGIWQCGVQSPSVTNFGAISANNFMGGNTNTGGATAYPLVTTTVGCPDKTSEYNYSHWVVREANGTLHPLPPSDSISAGGDSHCFHTHFTDTTIDGSGLTITASGASGYSVSPVITSGGLTINQAYPSATSITDPNSNVVSITSTDYNDTLGVIAASASPNVNAPAAVSWTDVKGNPQQVTVNTSNVKFQTNFGCASQGIADIAPTGSSPQFSGLTYPDGSSLGVTYEATTGKTGYVTGRISSLALPTGGTINYTYSTSCSNGGWTYQLVRTTNDGATTYSATAAGSTYGSYTTVTDQGGNVTAYTFSTPNSLGQSVLAEKQVKLGAATILSTILYCYNNNTSNCSTATVTLPITQMTVYTTIGSQTRQSSYTYDKYGNTLTDAEYDFGASSPTITTTTVYGSWGGSSCAAVSSSINDRPCTITITNGSNTIAQSHFTYDGVGNLTSKSVWTGKTSGTQWLTSTATYNGNGTVATQTDPSNNVTSYYYNGTGGCNGLFPTSVVADGMTTYNTWNCTGGVLATHTDANGNVTTYGYENSSGEAEPFWRQSSVTDPLNNEIWTSYTRTSKNSTLTFNGGNSTVNVTSIADSYGRLIDAQRLQSPTATQYDTTSTEYGWSGNYRSVTTTLPCSAASGAECSFSSAITTTLSDPLGRTYSVTDGGGGTITKSYPNNDVLSVLSPAPANENTKSVQREYDGLGRIKSVCGVMVNGGYTACAQNSGSYSGRLATYTYTYAAGSTTTKLTIGSQNRTKTFDALGRLTSVTTPEAGTTNLYYDSLSSGCAGSVNTAGRLIETIDPNGNTLCYSYDPLGRVLSINANGTTCRNFYYDNSSGFSGTIPSGISISNPLSHMVEAATSNCSTTLLTDFWFSYDKDANVLHQWEKTPNSGQYYHSTASFYGSGTVNTLQLTNPSFYTLTYGLDGEGRWDQMATGTQTIIPSSPSSPGVTFNPAGQPLQVKIGTGTDNDAYTYWPTTGRMENWTFTVGAKSESGTLNWNTNGTLNNLVITDGFNAGGTQTCYFNPSSGTAMGYDDLGRLLNDSCGPSGSIWNQTFNYDEYSNLTKASTSPGVTWNPGYNSTTNRYTLANTSYDSNGNLTADTFHNYEWNEFSKMKSVDRNGTNCATSGECIIYDAFGRAVEIDAGSAKTEIWYTQLGKTAYMTGSTINFAYWPAPGSGTVTINGNASAFYFEHKDWLGNARITSDIRAQTWYADQAYAPYGEIYDWFGNIATEYQSFTGDTQDIVSGTMDTPNREYNSGTQGRWLSPDPAGVGINLYAYTTNPNSGVDPTGLNVARGCFPPCDGGNGGLTPSSGPFTMGDNWDGSASTDPWNTYKKSAPLPRGIVETEAWVNGHVVWVQISDTDGTVWLDSSTGQGMDSSSISQLGAPSDGVLHWTPDPAAQLVAGTFNAPSAAVNNYVCGGSISCQVTLGAGIVALGFLGGDAFGGDIFDGDWEVNQGFTGVYDAETGTVAFAPSTYDEVIPEGWVDANGGHAVVSDALGGNSDNHFGFSAILQEDGSVQLTWKSGVLNSAYPGSMVPAEIQPQIVQAVQGLTSRQVTP